MRFFIQATQPMPLPVRCVAETIKDQYHDLDFTSPDHLADTLRDHIALNGLDLQVGRLSGAVTVNSPHGILLRFRTAN
ncbi:MAG TPA: hypothetical protein PLB89_05325 [Flavobacteriales bacterium]|nr:hypothetical protein [Flavobacteriales bacterium]